jgi:hypothetical protein
MSQSDQFIGIYENAFDNHFCDSLINYFNNLPSDVILNRQTENNMPKLQVDDCFIFGNLPEHSENIASAINTFNKDFWEKYYIEYANKFAVLQRIKRHNSYEFKVQKIKVGCGYHMWHFETEAKEVSNRIFTWMIYLNDVEEGGETEFLYQHMRVKPKKGTLVIFPAGYTHTHRGNPPLSNTKYIVTGWVEYE